MHLSLISVLVTAFSAASLVSATPTGPSTTGEPNSIPKLQGSSTAQGISVSSKLFPTPADIILKDMKEMRRKRVNPRKGNRLAKLYESGKKWSDLTNGVNFVLVESFDEWTNIVITSMTTIDWSPRDILKIQKAGHLLAWADRRKAQKYTESKIIIVKDLDFKEIYANEIRDNELADHLALLYRTMVSHWSDPTNGNYYVRVKNFKPEPLGDMSWGDIVITLMKPQATDRSGGQLDILKIQLEGRLLHWAMIKVRSMDAIIIVKKYLEPEPRSKQVVYFNQA